MKRASPLVQDALDLGEKPKKRGKVKLLTRVEPPEGLRWLSCDPCSLDLPDNPKKDPPLMGLAWWLGSTLLAAGTLGFDRRAEAWIVRVRRQYERTQVVRHAPSDFMAIRAVVRHIPGDEWNSFRLHALIMEKGFGANPKSVAQQAECRGFLRYAANEAGCEHVLTMDRGTWGRAVGQHYGMPYPKSSDDGKAHGLLLARKHFNLNLGDKDTDASDAVVQGVAVPYLGLLPTEVPTNEVV